MSTNLLPSPSNTARRSLPAILILLSFAFYQSGCRTISTQPGETTHATATTTIVGQANDEAGTPLAGVSVTAAGMTVTTDANGLFTFPDVTVRADRAFVVAKKSGYFTSGRAAMPTANGVTYMTFSLAANAPVGTISGSAGGKVTLPGGASLTLSPGGAATTSGSPYTGAISISAKHLDPSSASFSSLFPGDLTGQRTDGSEALLLSYGVMMGELHAANGDILQPASGTPAILTVPIAASQLATAPASIPLWYFDETLGMWKEEGSATKVGNVYTGSVNHFSSWNCDWSGPWGTIKGRILCNDVPIPGVVVNVGTSGQQPVTDGAGVFTVKVPAGTNNVAIQVKSSENHGMYYTNTPRPVAVPQDVTTDLGDFGLNSICPTYLQGVLKDCNNEPIPGMILASYPGNLSYVYTKNGSFKIVAGANSIVTLAATATSGAVAQPITLLAGDQGALFTVKDLIACSNLPSDVKIDISGRYGSRSVTFSPDGSKIATIDTNGMDLMLLDVASGTILKTISNAFTQPDYTEWVRFSPDGTKLMSYQVGYPSGKFNCWLLDGTRITPASVNAISAIFGPGSKSVIASDSKHVFEFDLTTLAETRTYPIPVNNYGTVSLVSLTNGGAQFVAFAPDVNWVNTAYIWNIAGNALASKFTVAQGITRDSIGTAATDGVSSDGLVLGADDYSFVHFFNTQTGIELSKNVKLPSMASYAIAPDDATFFGGYRAGSNNTIGFFSIADGKPIHLMTAPASLGFSGPVALSHDGKLAAALYPGKIRIWNVQ